MIVLLPSPWNPPHMPLTSRVGRADARDVRYKLLVPGTAAEEFRHHAEVFAGLSFGLGGAPKDLDRDGIPEKTDKCPGTPFGARVDASGCPLDGDGEGV
jgi:hypothetical protein